MMLGHGLLSFLVPAAWLLGEHTVTAAAVAIGKRQDSATQISVAQLDSYTDYTQFARVAYCNPTLDWNCGDSCDAVSTFRPVLVGGDGNDIQDYFVGYFPDDNTVIVAHQGTDFDDILSVLTDVDIVRTNLNSTLFPGVPNSVLVHQGFADEHALTAEVIFAAVQSTLSSTGAQSVTLVGHSLGGAIALLDALYFKLNLPSNIAIKAVTYGLPRVGNSAFASLIDKLVPDLTRITNQLDMVPTLPSEWMGFQHPHGEIHIVKANVAYACLGDDNDVNRQCTDQSVPDLLAGDIYDHLGPYPPYPAGITIGSGGC